MRACKHRGKISLHETEESLTIVIDDQPSLDLEDLLKGLFGERIPALRLRPLREGRPDLLDRGVRFGAKQLTDVGEGDGIGRSAPTSVEAVPVSAERVDRLLLEVLPYSLQIDEG